MSLLRSVLQGLSGWATPVPRADLAELLPWALGQVEPRLRLMPGCDRRYGPILARALVYCEGLAGQVPGPVVVDRLAFAQDPLVHALFGSPDDIVQALVGSAAVRDWQRAHPDTQHAYALLGVRRCEKHMLGVSVEHGALRRDVPQTATYFSDHTFSNLALTPEAARALLVRQFMASLLARVKDRIEALRTRRHALEQECDELRARLRGHARDASLQQALDRTLAELGEAVGQLDLRAYPAHFEAVIGQAAQYLQINVCDVRLDAMGLCPANDAECVSRVHEIRLHEITCRDRRKWTILLTRFSLAEVPSYPARLAAVERWLAI